MNNTKGELSTSKCPIIISIATDKTDLETGYCMMIKVRSVGYQAAATIVSEASEQLSYIAQYSYYMQFPSCMLFNVRRKK